VVDAPLFCLCCREIAHVERRLDATCVRCGRLACSFCDKCYGCKKVICDVCNLAPTPPFAYPGDRGTHPQSVPA